MRPLSRIGAAALLLATAGGLALPGRAQQVAGSVEAGLQGLAQDIVAKSAAADRDVVAVLPFPSTDGTCSVLSTYLADELIQALFSVPNSPLRIIERSQLEAVIREIQIGEGGLLNPDTTQKLGNVSGVKGLVVGTITEIGDRVRINARLVATDTGQTVSAAAVTVPRTADVDGLLRRVLQGSGGSCLTSAGGSRARPATSPGAAVPIARGQASGQAALIQGVSFGLQSAKRSTDGRSVSIILSVTNAEGVPLYALLVGPKPTIIFDDASSAETENVTGLPVCSINRRPFWDVRHCARVPRTSWTTLNPGLPRSVLLQFTMPQPTRSTRLTLTANLVVEPAPDDETRRPARNGAGARSITLSLTDIGVVPGSP